MCLSPDAETRVRLVDAYEKQPLGFEVNRGQTESDVQFLSRSAGYTLFLTSTEAVLALQKTSSKADERARTTVLRMKLVGSDPLPRVSRQDELPGRTNYIKGSDRRSWRTQVHHYRKVKYEDVAISQQRGRK